MKNDIHYRLDYGEYIQPEQLEYVCREDCRFFSDCPEKGGFCSFKIRDVVFSRVELERKVLFWRFPAGKGAVEPWRRKLWELYNKF